MAGRTVLSFALAAAFAGGCASVLGVDQNYAVDDGGGATDDATTGDGDATNGDGHAGDGPSSDGRGGDADARVVDAKGDGQCVPSGPENCTNGVDDDCNGKTDCADPACQAYSCVPAVPQGWQGPVELFDAMGNPPPSPPPCDALHGGGMYDGNAGLTFGPATCTGCSCGQPDTTCSAVFTPYLDNVCSQPCSAPVTLTSGTCVPMPFGNCASTADWSTTQPVPSGGSCPPSGGSASTSPASWSENGRTCAVPAVGGGCASGVCAATSAAPFGAGACVFHDGDTACPQSYAVKHLYYGGSTDTRACTACACGMPQNVFCMGGSFDFFAGSNCTGNKVGHGVHPCFNGGQVPTGSVMLQASASGGSCTPSGGAPTGTVTPTSPTTVCCTQ